MFDNEAATKKFSRRTRIIGSAAGVATALIAVGVGIQPATASGATGTTSAAQDGAAAALVTTAAPAVPAAAAAPAPAAAAPALGSKNLVQSNDFVPQGLVGVSATVDLTGGQGLSACSGEETMRVLTNGGAAAYASATWILDPISSTLVESLAQGSTDKAATSYEKLLNDQVRSCQDEVAGHWYYGPAHAFTVTGGEGHWYTSYNGDGAVSGGVAVIRSGNRVGIIEVAGEPGSDPAYIRGLAGIAISDLAS
jgi:hypothetical protein